MYHFHYLALLLTVGCSALGEQKEFTCAETEIVISDPAIPRIPGGPVEADLTRYERETLYRARVRCSFFYEHSPCVARFEIYDRAAKAYRVTCTEEEYR